MAAEGKHLVADPGARLNRIARDDRAACAGSDPKGYKFYGPDRPAELAHPALRVCGSCDIRRACLEEVLAIHESFDPGGIWGGTRPRDRKRMRVERRAS